MSVNWLITAVLILLVPLVTHAQDDSAAWEALREGRAVLMLRHSLAPGTGDPAHFDPEDCATQRNLSDQGREQARAWKPLLSRHGIDEARVYTSQWCRSRDTATEMDAGEVTEWPALNSFFQSRDREAVQTRRTIALVNALEPGLPVVLVSHQVNITALTGIYPSSNEGVILALPLTVNADVMARVSPD